MKSLSSFRITLISLVFLFLMFGVVGNSTFAEDKSSQRGLVFESSTAEQLLARTSRERDYSAVDHVSQQGQQARGLYFNGLVAKRLGAQGMIKMLKGAFLDAAVIDLKDNEGRVFYDTKIDVLQPQKSNVFVDRQLVGELKKAGIYAIARVVCFSDPKLPRTHPERAIMDGRPHKRGVVWANWGRRSTWLDPYNESNHQLLVDIAREVEALGFDEIQLDYIRFPVDWATNFAVFPAKYKAPRVRVITGVLREIDAAISIPVGADIFGVAAFYYGDTEGLGQVAEEWVEHVEVFSPMLYLNAMRKWLEGTKEQRALRLVHRGVATLRRRIGKGPVIRPFLQAYPQGADYFNSDFIVEQISASRLGGADGFLFWSPGSSYGLVRSTTSGPARRLIPFPVDKRKEWRMQNYGERSKFAVGGPRDNGSESFRQPVSQRPVQRNSGR